MLAHIGRAAGGLGLRHASRRLPRQVTRHPLSSCVSQTARAMIKQAIHRRRPCRNVKRSSGRTRMRGRARRPRRRLASSCARRCITCVRGSTAHGRPSRPLQSGCRRRGAPGSNLGRLRREPPRSEPVARPRATQPRDAQARNEVSPAAAHARSRVRSAARGVRLRRAVRSPGKRARVLDGALRPSVRLRRGRQDERREQLVDRPPRGRRLGLVRGADRAPYK